MFHICFADTESTSVSNFVLMSHASDWKWKEKNIKLPSSQQESLDWDSACLKQYENCSQKVSTRMCIVFIMSKQKKEVCMCEWMHFIIICAARVSEFRDSFRFSGSPGECIIFILIYHKVPVKTKQTTPKCKQWPAGLLCVCVTAGLSRTTACGLTGWITAQMHWLDFYGINVLGIDWYEIVFNWKCQAQFIF